MSSKTLTIVVPAYNEAASLSSFLPALLDRVERTGWKLIFVNDGSADDTGALLDDALDRPGCRVIHHKVNRGYGGAIKTGIAAADTDYVVTIDADGQHYLDDVEMLLKEVVARDADMIVGSRKGQPSSSRYRHFGKWLLRNIAKLLIPLDIHDINSGMKIYDTTLAQRYLGLCPDSMAFSDVITMVFVSQRHRVLELPIRVKQRIAGASTITTRTALETLIEILNIVVLFNPLKIFLPISLLSIVLGFAWGIPIVLDKRGVSVGAMLAIVTGVIFFFLGLLAEQIAMIRRDKRS
jgi:glycosyltransferase involved in cell wall biosynthesis